jgi:hypothetical protein
LDIAEKECFGYSASEIRGGPKREFLNQAIEDAYNTWKEKKLKLIERAELGLLEEIPAPKTASVTPK